MKISPQNTDKAIGAAKKNKVFCRGTVGVPLSRRPGDLGSGEVHGPRGARGRRLLLGPRRGALSVEVAFELC